MDPSHHQPAVKPLSIITALSLLANVAFATWWLNTLPTNRHPFDQPAAAPAPTNTAIGAYSLSWSDIETNDLKEFLHRLHAVDCPENTARDLVLDELDRRYGAKKLELWPDRKTPPPYWKAEKHDPVSEKLRWEKQKRNRELEREKTAELVELFGKDPRPQRYLTEGFGSPSVWADARVAFLPAAQRDSVARYLDDFEDRMQDFYTTNAGLEDAQYRAELKQLEAERLQGLAQFLPPQAVREFELRHSQLAGQLASELRYMPPLTRAQYETLYDIRKKYSDSISQFPDAPNPRADANQQAMLAEIASALGPDLATSYHHVRDASFVQLARLAARHNLPDDTATRVFDARESAQESLRQLENNPALTPDQRRQNTLRIRTETINAFKNILGETAYNHYLRNGDKWFTELASNPAREGASP